MRSNKLLRVGKIGFLLVLIWMAVTPRGRIDPSTVSLLPDGTTLHDASKIIGLPNGCHDGFWDENYHFVRPKSDIDIAYWVTADGMISLSCRGNGRFNMHGTYRVQTGLASRSLAC